MKLNEAKLVQATIAQTFGDPKAMEKIAEAHAILIAQPKTVIINNFEIPAPLNAQPDVNSMVYMPNILNPNRPDAFEWRYAERLMNPDELIAQGIVHATPEAAVDHAKALLSFH